MLTYRLEHRQITRRYYVTLFAYPIEWIHKTFALMLGAGQRLFLRKKTLDKFTVITLYFLIVMAYVKIQPGPADGYDTYIDEANPDTNYQNATALKIKGPSPNRCHAFLNFFFEQVPRGSTVISAKIGIYISKVDENEEVQLSQVVDAWYVDTLTWNTRPIPGMKAIKGTAVLNDWLEFDVKEMVQYWFDNPEWNLGVQIAGHLCEDSDSEIYSSNYLGDPTKRPYIEITYTPKTGGYTAGFEKIYDEILTAAQTTVTISNLTGNSDEIYLLHFWWENPVAAVVNLYLRFNGDAGENYGQQYLLVDGAAATPSRSPLLSALLLARNWAQTRYSSGKVYIYAKSGHYRSLVHESMTNAYIVGNNIYPSLDMGAGLWKNAASEITSIVLFVTQANAMKAGTHFTLYRKIPNL